MKQPCLKTTGKLSRKDSFHPESALPAQDRAELSVYARSGYDRGPHVAQRRLYQSLGASQSFSLANMVPQVHANNAGIWAGIEGAVRQLAIQEGELYVVSGPVFIGDDIQQVGLVLVPTHLWKVLYSPKQPRAGAYVVSNDEMREYSTVPVSDLKAMVCVSLLPALPQNIRDVGMILPNPSAQRGKKPKRKAEVPTEEFTLQDFSRSIIDAIKRADQH